MKNHQINHVFTHRGWFWFCPIYLSLNGEEANVEARYAWLEPLFSLAEIFESCRIFISTLIWPNYEPQFMFRITGEIER